jgi:hypothetical protein
MCLDSPQASHLLLADVLDTILDKGLVIDIDVRVSRGTDTLAIRW